MGSPRDEAIACAGAAAAHGLVDGLAHAAPVVQQRAPVHHDLGLPALQAAPALRPVCHDGQLCPALLILCTYYLGPIGTGCTSVQPIKKTMTAVALSRRAMVTTCSP